MEVKETVQISLTILGLLASFIGGIVAAVWKFSKMFNNAPKELTEYFNKAIKDLSESIDRNVKALNEHGENLSKQVAVMNNTIEKSIILRLETMETSLKETNIEVRNLHLKVLAIDVKYFEKSLSKE